MLHPFGAGKTSLEVVRHGVGGSAQTERWLLHSGTVAHAGRNTHSGGRRLMSPVTKTQRLILDAFDLTEDDIKSYITSSSA
jgi:hypothetical protein